MQVSHVRSLRWLLIVLIAVVLVSVAFNYVQTWRERARVVKHAAQILSSDMMRAGEGIEYSEYENGALRFKIRADKLLETRQGTSMLQGIQASDLNPDGSVGGRIRSRKAEYDRNHKQAYFSEDVQIELGQEIRLQTTSLHYDLNKNVGSTEDPFQFISNQVRGNAKGFRYDHYGKDLYLNGNVSFVVTRAVIKPDGSVEAEDFRVTSERGYLSRAAQFFRFEGKAHLDSATASLSGDKIEATFSADMKQLRSLFCEGNASYESSVPADLRTLSGDRIVFGIGRTSGALESIDVQGRAAFISKSPGADQEMHAGQVVLDLDPAKGSPNRIRSQGTVEVHFKRGPQDTVISGERLETGFVTGTSLLQNMRVWDHARVLMKVPGKGKDELQAEEIRLSFRNLEGRSALQELQADRSVQWNSAPDTLAGDHRAGETRSMDAAFLRMTYSESEDSLESGNASGNVVVAGIPAGASRQEIRRMLADTVQFQFYPRDNRLKCFEGEGHVQVFYSKPVNPAADVQQEFRTSSSNIRATFQESDGTADSLSQWGNFTYRDGSRTATSGRSDYDAKKEILVLRESPQIVDINGVTSGELVEYDRKNKILSVRRQVRSVLKAREGSGAPPFSTSSGAPSATIVTAEQMQYWTEEARARYAGNVQLLAETSQLAADSLEILKGGDFVQAQGSARHLVLRREQGTGTTPGEKARLQEDGKQSAEAAPTLIRCDRLKYVQAERSIHYSGDVNLRSGDIEMSSENMDVIFDAAGKQIERATATGKLLIRQAGRIARGDAADYYLTPGKFVVTGNLAEIHDPTRGKSAARRLTFFTTNDRILLENR